MKGRGRHFIIYEYLYLITITIHGIHLKFFEVFVIILLSFDLKLKKILDFAFIPNNRSFPLFIALILQLNLNLKTSKLFCVYMD
jgi:hypothetical protein